MPPKSLPFTPDKAAQVLLAKKPIALTTGLVLYQQIPIEKAFMGPAVLQDRLGKELTAEAVAATDVDDVIEMFRETPAIHRFPANMAKRVHATCTYVVEELDGNIPSLWSGAEDASTVIKSMKKLPGFGDYKARVYFGVVSKWWDVKPAGWEELVPDWPSIVDLDTIEDIDELKARKKAWKDSQS
ncbi:MAG: Fe-S cluster assembly protein HesB [Acidimicrobiia bacterium]|nr:Fe-S cluster assembly protein HesB [Acidimicrobiia bacterium]